MKTALDCVPCILRQGVEAAKQMSTSSAVHRQIVRELLRWVSESSWSEPPPVFGQRIHRRLREIVGVQDPYRSAKDQQNHMALSLLPELKARIEAASDPLLVALRVAIGGNVIDMGANGNVTEAATRESIRQALTTPLVGNEGEFREATGDAQRILYLTDNAGEIAFDRLLIEQLGPARVTVAVRGAPVINDATLTDAREVGLLEIVEIIDNGSDAPGTVLDDCSPEFKRRFTEADLILAKGQGNFETLSDVPGNILFLFKAKCPVIAAHAGVPLGTHVLTRSRAGQGVGGLQ